MNATVRFLRRRWYVVLAAVAAMVFGWLVRSTLSDAADRKAARARSAAELAQTQDAATKANQAVQILLSVTGPDAQTRQSIATEDILRRNALTAGIEADCRSRRQQARLAAPADPSRPCVDQTPIDVYPGQEGTPPRG